MEQPASPPQSLPADAEGGWIDEVRQGLRAGPAGALILVDNAVPEDLAALVRALRADHPGVDVVVGTDDLAIARDGSVMVWLPEPADADWLRRSRPLIARKALNLVVVCRRGVSE